MRGSARLALPLLILLLAICPASYNTHAPLDVRPGLTLVYEAELNGTRCLLTVRVLLPSEFHEQPSAALLLIFNASSMPRLAATFSLLDGSVISGNLSMPKVPFFVPPSMLCADLRWDVPLRLMGVRGGLVLLADPEGRIRAYNATTGILHEGELVLGDFMVRLRLRASNARRGLPGEYPPLDAIYDELARLPNETARVLVIGRSALGRKILAVEFGPSPARRYVVVVGGIHGSELIGVRAALAVIRWLASELQQDGAIAQKLRELSLAVAVIPVLNPDGYAAARLLPPDPEENRFARCNARYVDLNRNFDFMWSAGGSPCFGDSTYHGPAPFSEPESRALRDYLLSRNVVVLIDLHSGAEMIIVPSGTRLDSVLGDLAERLSRITGLPLVYGRPYGGAIWWTYRAYRGGGRAFAFIVELYEGSGGDWLTEYNPTEPETITAICDTTVELVKAVIMQADRLIEAAEARQRAPARLPLMILALVSLILLIAVARRAKVKRS